MAAACVFEPQNKALAGLLKAQRALDHGVSRLFGQPFPLGRVVPGGRVELPTKGL